MAILDVKQIKNLAGFGPHDIGTMRAIGMGLSRFS
jgi:hypothetical protein